MAVDLLNIRGLKELDHQGPVVMVNLMRFHDRSLDGDGSGRSFSNGERKGEDSLVPRARQFRQRQRLAFRQGLLK